MPISGGWRWILLILPLAACASGFSITTRDSGKYPATQAIELLFETPRRPYKVIANFDDKEQERCPKDLPYCSLRRSAQEIGAHAILVTRVDRYRYLGDWMLIEGRLTRLYPHESERIEGVLIRYTDEAPSAPAGK